MDPKQNLTERVRKILDFAREEALKSESEFVGTEHLLIGIILEKEGIAGKLMANLNVDLKRVRAEIKKLMTKASRSPVLLKTLPYSPRAVHALELAHEAASQLGHDLIATEHILLGLLKETEGVAASILQNLGLKLEEIRDLVFEMIGADIGAPPPKPMTKHFVSASCRGKSCDICGLPSSHKVGEEIPHDDPMGGRHNYTSYVCCFCFRKIFGKGVPCDLLLRKLLSGREG